MDWNEYKRHIKDEWGFYKRNPEMILFWVMVLGSAIYCFIKS